MTAKSHSRGHEIIHEEGGWIFSDNREPAFTERPCKTCGEKPFELLLKNQEGIWEVKQIDHCIAPIVRALQYGGIDMIACCCGHKKRNGWITLADGRVLVLRK